jgi:hypothetical protein
MYPEYVAKALRGAGWYILLEDGKMLEGGPFPSEEATWAEIARRTPKEAPSRCLWRRSQVTAPCPERGQ